MANMRRGNRPKPKGPSSGRAKPSTVTPDDDTSDDDTDVIDGERGAASSAKTDDRHDKRDAESDGKIGIAIDDDKPDTRSDDNRGEARRDAIPPEGLA